jgi:uncharacterized protein YdhG (YjbR/CyaY superfamily)
MNADSLEVIMNISPDVEKYIAGFPQAVQPILQRVRETVRAHAPDTVERIGYGIPTYWQGENVIHFGGAKNHIGLYPGAEAMVVFAGRLTDYHTAKGSIQFPLDRPIPYDLIADITDYRVKAATERQQTKKKAKT